MAHYPIVRVAAIQAAPVYLNTEATVEKTCKLVKEAADQGAKVIAFPEAFIPGYPWWIWFGNSDYGMKFYIQLYKNAVEIPGKHIRSLSEAARENQVYFCVSVTEKDGGSLYLTQLWFDPNGNLIGKHRKLKATNAEMTIWGDGDGSMMPVFNTPYGRLGGLQCWENNIPLNEAAMSSLNEQIHVASWPSFFPAEEHLFSVNPCETVQRCYSITTQTFSLMSSQLWTKEMEDMLCETEEQKKIMSYGFGCTRIIAPNGKILASVPHDQEGVAIADIDLSTIIPGKFLTDPAGHYSTPSCLRLVFDQTEHFPVKKLGEQTSLFLAYEDILEAE